jgi:hypothetical protein
MFSRYPFIELKYSDLAVIVVGCRGGDRIIPAQLKACVDWVSANKLKK